MSTAENTGLNLNPARLDKFTLVLGNIPSIPLLTPDELEGLNQIQHETQEKHFFHLALKGVEIPGFSLGESKIDSMFNSVAEVDNKYTFENLTTEIRVDNNFLIYKMLMLWMLLTNRPDEFNQFGNADTKEKTFSQAILNLKDNFNSTVISFEFYDLRPIVLPSIPMSYNNEGDEIVINVTWQYTYFMPRTANGEAYNLNL